MKPQSDVTDQSSCPICPRPELRGNLFLGLLLGFHLVMALPSSFSCAYAQSAPGNAIAVESPGC